MSIMFQDRVRVQVKAIVMVMVKVKAMVHAVWQNRM